ncbi:Cytochrome P450 family protein [Quillaja saponaria]|uniref:Cytochrome P450 family protein n=1 Tax=Quillaja saponaria TaxID=32244 RepID=A0AAD7KMY5_QUISA|nr:Cytochrome P450 family protein [Quillaja saponaria]KAJ7950548.1 Cytochrome P450 family protein [Quillaja saponaria]
MEFSFSFLKVIAAAILGLLLLYHLRRRKISSQEFNGKQAPEPSGSLPLIGHLHLFGRKTPVYQTLSAMADKVGPIFIVRLGKSPTLVISSHEAAKECFTINDKIFASRPNSSQGTYICYDSASFGMAPYGPYWRDVRKIVKHELLSSRRLDTLNHVYVSEIGSFVKDLYLFSNNNAKSVVVLDKWFERFSLNITTKIIAGKRYFDSFHDEIVGETERLQKLIKEVMYLMGRLDVSDLIPILGWFNVESQILKSMKRVSKDFDNLLGSWLQEHTKKWQKGETKEPEDFIDVMLSMLEEDCIETYGHSRDTIIKATIMSIIVAGADTTSVHLTWLIAALLNNTDVLKRAQEEVDLHVGRDRWVELSDIKNLSYLQAFIKETLRLYVPGPLLIPHMAREDCEVGGYHIAKGTQLLVNAWKLQRDPRVWADPERFMPERFLTSHVDMDASGINFEFIPFGTGRRGCPGYTFASQVAHLMIARLVQGFEFATPMNEPVDMSSDGLGIALNKATPLQVLVTPRLSMELYRC